MAMMSELSRMTHDELNDAYDEQTRQIAKWEAIADGLDDDDPPYVPGMPTQMIDEYVEERRRVLDEQKRRMGIWCER